MNQKKFLEILKRQLRHLPKEDREDAILYYEEYFAEMNVTGDEDVTNKVGLPKEVAKEILSECSKKHLNTQKEKGGIKNSATVIWMILLGIYALPFALPVIGVLFVFFVTSILVAASILLVVGGTGAVLVLTGMLSTPCLFWASAIPQKFVCIGIGLICIAIGILLVMAMIKIFECFARGIAVLFQKAFYGKKGE